MQLDLEFLRDRKNLLAFSGGVDSSALFYLLEQNGVAFDLVMVDYGVRKESIKEVDYAKKLAKEYGKKLFLHKAKKIGSNFEHQARTLRYEYFKTVVLKNGYDCVITAHQLNDRLEWFLMQLSKGAGLAEIVGMQKLSKKDGYTLVRPLLDIAKEDLLCYLQSRGYRYFVDHTNSDTKYKRNHFRKAFSDQFLHSYKDGVRQSFHYLQKDLDALEATHELLYEKKQLRIYRVTQRSLLLAVSKALKEFGYVLSSTQRAAIEKSSSVVIGGRFCVGYEKNLLYICLYEKAVMDKKFKEKCRILGIPKHVRTYFYTHKIDPNIIKKFQ